MRLPKITGYILGIGGLLILAWNAYTYISRKTMDNITTGTGILLCITGAALIVQLRKKEGGQKQ